jgi:hypothetical protein
MRAQLKSGTITIAPITNTMAALIKSPSARAISVSDDFGAGIPQLPRPQSDTHVPVRVLQSETRGPQHLDRSRGCMATLPSPRTQLGRPQGLKHDNQDVGRDRQPDPEIG